MTESFKTTMKKINTKIKYGDKKGAMSVLNLVNMKSFSVEEKRKIIKTKTKLLFSQERFDEAKKEIEKITCPISDKDPGIKEIEELLGLINYFSGDSKINPSGSKMKNKITKPRRLYYL